MMLCLNLNWYGAMVRLPEEQWWQLCTKQLKDNHDDTTTLNEQLAQQFLQEEKIRHLQSNVIQFYKNMAKGFMLL